MTNPTGTQYLPDTQWVRVQVRISTHWYGYGYEFLPVAYLLAGG
jgi:hypothetical protein